MSEPTSVQIYQGEVIERPNRKPGRPTKMTPDTIAKLEQAFAEGQTDLQACFTAGIGTDTLYRYIEQHPEYEARKNALKGNIAVQAKKSILKHIPRDGKLALDVIERLEKNEWSLRTEITGAEGEPMSFTFVPPKS